MKEKVEKTRERIFGENFESKEEYLIFLRHMFEHKVAIKNIPQDSFVLDIGCGEGYGTNSLSKHVKKIVGMDVDNDTLIDASNKYKSENCTFKLYNGTNIPYDDGTFDVVVSFHVIEHVQDDLNFVSEIYRVLKDGGVFIVSTPNKTFRVKKNGKLFNEFHIREYYSFELEKVLKSKFSNVKLVGVFGDSEVQRIEIERLKMILKITTLDVFNLRRIIPKSIEKIIMKFFKSVFCRKKEKLEEGSFLERYSTKNYHFDEKDIKNSLDLLAICRK